MIRQGTAIHMIVAWINKQFDLLVRSDVHILNYSWPAFRFMGCVGFVLSVLLTLSLVVYRGLSIITMVGIICLAVSTFVGLNLITKIITGSERINNYHHQIAVLLVIPLWLQWLGKPVFPYLDITILGVGVFIAFGRLGCLMVGCCHGQPHSWGVCYQKAHIDGGFPSYYVGVRLFPVQLVESLWYFYIVLVGCILLLAGSPAGSTLATYLILVGFGRFHLEFLRGDKERAYISGFSEAQWISLLLVAGVLAAEQISLLPLSERHIFLGSAMVFSIVYESGKTALHGKLEWQLFHPSHIWEVASAVELLSDLAVYRCENCDPEFGVPVVHIGCTSVGFQISSSLLNTRQGLIYQYSLSLNGKDITDEIARKLARFIILIKYPECSSQLIRGNHNIFHLLISDIRLS